MSAIFDALLRLSIKLRALTVTSGLPGPLTFQARIMSEINV
jgi:hypothetical protein